MLQQQNNMLCSQHLLVLLPKTCISLDASDYQLLVSGLPKVSLDYSDIWRFHFKIKYRSHDKFHNITTFNNLQKGISQWFSPVNIMPLKTHRKSLQYKDLVVYGTKIISIQKLIHFFSLKKGVQTLRYINKAHIKYKHRQSHKMCQTQRG